MQAPHASAGAPSIGAGASTTACPSCGEPRVDAGARFCEVCRHDFVGGQPGRAPTTPKRTPATTTTTTTTTTTKWQLVVSVDPALDVEPDPTTPCPVGRAPETIGVGAAELLVGRHDDLRDIRPDIALLDPGASRRHAKFVTSGDALALQDLASTNGTRLNGADVVPGSKSSLKDGDEVSIGRWTRITIRGAL